MKRVVNTTEDVNANPSSFLTLAMAAGPSAAIQDQETRGQLSLVNSDTLPTQMAPEDRAALEQVGFKFLGPVEGDSIFQYVQMAPGWKKERTDHSMWSDLLDGKGRKRGSIFYKAAFYDRNAHMYMITRFQVQRDHERALSSGEVVFRVHDRANKYTVVWTSEAIPDQGDFTIEKYNAEKDLEKTAVAWLKEHYPDSANPAAYWD
jgi:hypothetical protein